MRPELGLQSRCANAVSCRGITSPSQPCHSGWPCTEISGWPCRSGWPCTALVTVSRRQLVGTRQEGIDLQAKGPSKEGGRAEPVCLGPRCLGPPSSLPRERWREGQKRPSTSPLLERVLKLSTLPFLLCGNMRGVFLSKNAHECSGQTVQKRISGRRNRMYKGLM